MAASLVVETPYLRMLERDGWFFVERPNAKGIVTIVPLTRDGRLVFVEQHRIPVNRRVIEFPAGLIGDEAGHENEDLLVAAVRELEEETGFRAQDVALVSTTATSPGMANELVHFVLAWNLDRVGPGGGTPAEDIKVHEVPLRNARSWLAERENQGLLVAAKVFAGLYFANERWG